MAGELCAQGWRWGGRAPSPPYSPFPAPSHSSFPRGPRDGLRGLAAQPAGLVCTHILPGRPLLAAQVPKQHSLCPGWSQEQLSRCPACFSQARLGRLKHGHHGNNADHLSCPSSLLPSCFLSLCRPPGVLALSQLGPGRTHSAPPPHPPWDLSWAGAESRGVSSAVGAPHLLPVLTRCRL